MKRFYCTVCKKVKRVRVFPAGTEDTTSVTPTSRVGVCRFHSLVRVEKPSRVRRVVSLTSHEVAADKPRKTGKKGR